MAAGGKFAYREALSRCGHTSLQPNSVAQHWFPDLC